ncbi:uncharacterized protein SCHCODRAFT_02701879 [Schizophyllum commune H4-8]|nr:uncharacterized protein SCHCODRAFT_02701879 [Schizophyllum commune H4-8]KAI5890994.1 hypothetical protein SCHCODRAFT_02701879 [Schizophyllum commune H4-8]
MSPPTKSSGSDRASSTSQSPRSRWLPPRGGPLPRDLQGLMSPPTQHTSLSSSSPYYASSEAGSSSSSSISSSASESSRGSLAFIINEPERVGVTGAGSRQRAELALPPLEGGRHWVPYEMIERIQPAFPRSSPEDASTSTSSSAQSRSSRATAAHLGRPGARRQTLAARRQPPAAWHQPSPPRLATGPSHAPGRTPPRLISPGWGVVAGVSASTSAGPSTSTSTNAYGSDNDAPIPNPKPKRRGNKKRRRNADNDVADATRYVDGDVLEVEVALNSSASRSTGVQQEPRVPKRAARASFRGIARRIEALEHDAGISEFGAHHITCAGCGTIKQNEMRDDFYNNLGNKHIELCPDIHKWVCINDPDNFAPPSQELLRKQAEQRRACAEEARKYLEGGKKKCKCIDLGKEKEFLDGTFKSEKSSVSWRGPDDPKVKPSASAIRIFVGGRLERIMPRQYAHTTLPEYIAERMREDAASRQSTATEVTQPTEDVTMAQPAAVVGSTIEDGSMTVVDPSVVVDSMAGVFGSAAPSPHSDTRDYADAEAWTGERTWTWVEERPIDEYEDGDNTSDVDENLETPYLDAALAEGWVPRWSRTPPSQHERLASESASSSSARETSSASSDGSSAPSSVEGPSPVQAGKKRCHDEMTRRFSALSVTVHGGTDAPDAISSISRIETKDNGRWPRAFVCRPPPIPQCSPYLLARSIHKYDTPPAP